MEVHHHTHHPKKRKEYFWEFFMLFLAVFCGFLAEIQVEHYVEHQREKKYINQLLLDLRADEKNLEQYLSGVINRGQRIDSLFYLIRSNEYKMRNNDVYFFARILSRYSNYVPTDGTISQLKFGGNLRLIKKDIIVATLMDYDIETKVLTQFIATSFQDILNFRLSAEELFDAKSFYDMIDANNEIQRLNNCPPLVDNSPLKLNTLLMRLQYMKSANGRYINRATELLKKEKELKGLIEKEYHIY